MHPAKFGEGDYRERQQQANAGACVGVAEHINAAQSSSSICRLAITGANTFLHNRNAMYWDARAAERELDFYGRGTTIGFVAAVSRPTVPNLCRGNPARARGDQATGRDTRNSGCRRQQALEVKARRFRGGSKRGHYTLNM